mmetsp:Transcript_58084/g.160635  ORF Transcript_58084/g.160635 Transcript_58084/m.160635 type:complete len:82 (+) Transcript_58084:914-1159(+)
MLASLFISASSSALQGGWSQRGDVWGGRDRGGGRSEVGVHAKVGFNYWQEQATQGLAGRQIPDDAPGTSLLWALVDERNVQ